MQAKVGERIRIQGKAVGDHARGGVILEVRGDNGGPPYLVRFDDEHERLVYPGPDTVIEHAPSE